MNRGTRSLWISGLAAMAVIGAASRVSAQLSVAQIVGDHMVIQREARVPIRGEGSPGAGVTVRLGDRAEVSARVRDDGRWSALLPELQAGGPYVLTVRSGDQEIVIEDVMVGDVWIASGQSNMEWPVGQSRNAEAEIAAADDPAIRQYRVPRSWSETPQPDLVGGEWQVSDATHVGSQSAVAYFFARSLREHVDVPIGIIDNSWGGARIEPFMSAAALGLDQRATAEMFRVQAAYDARLLETLRRRIGDLPDEDPGLVDGRAVWADSDLDDSDWAPIRVPGLWEDQGYPGLDGVVWYRRTFELSPEEAGSPLELGVGMVDDADITWVNGQEVGRTDGYNRPRRYSVPAALLRSGTNTLVVRAQDTGGGGGIHGDPGLLYLESGGARRSLAGDWRFRVGQVSLDTNSQKNQVPMVLYNQMVHPLVTYPVAGFIWYQGESNAYPQEAYEYRRRFRAMIRDWREAWGRGDLPFLWVQLANFMEPGDGTTPSDWAMLRESQTAALTLSKTAQALAIDIGEAGDIHPRNKQDVGDRLARAARAVAYGQEVVYSGPVYRSHVVRPDGRIAVEFDHVGGGLVARDGPDVGGFAVAGPEGRFVPARARIEGNRVVVWSAEVSRPTEVRYAWADNPVGANLYNAEGLPATPFRTDRTIGVRIGR
jgi:sialate O-acetylesterase